MELRGARILITGASRGLGADAARELARRGAHLVLSARDEARLSALAEELAAEVVVADLARRDDVERLHAVAADCDGLLLNAGIGDDPLLDDVDDATVDRMLDVNLRAPVLLATRYAQARQAAGRGGAVVLVGSLAGVAASPGTRLYNATKFGLRGFALSFAEELHGTTVSCSLVAPGFVRDAGMFHDAGVQLPTGVRTASPADVTAAVVRGMTDPAPEIVAAPIEVALAARLGGLAPRLSGRAQRLLDADGRRRRGEAQRERPRR